MYKFVQPTTPKYLNNQFKILPQYKISNTKMGQPQIQTRVIPTNFSSDYDNEILKILFPTILTMSLDPALSLIDASLVARLGSAQLAGVGMSAVQIALLTNLFTFLMILTVPQVAERWVQNDLDGIAKNVSDKIWLATLIGGLVSVLVVSFAKAFFQLLELTQLQHSMP
eukprot:TRINITY_DN98078_c0_g1_i1.p1 TRINITY_DN98078_c0_g1~~TRINITY_DN98078_c0_g1_i1.p1  ORF type:complete len:169 (+),score=2.65 TRINITY_DN98078_c0_g1_i1:29-535(+)